MAETMPTVIYPTRDLARSRDLFTALLGTEPYVDQPYYVGYRVGGQETGLNPHGHDEGMSGPVCYHSVADMASALSELRSAGAEIHRDARDVGGGKLIAVVRDADGNLIGLSQEPPGA